MKEFNIKEHVRQLPEVPGVYLMHSETDEIIYVGKAINLKSRVSQYFRKNEDRQNRIKRMIANIAWFEVIEVETELEALILESNLIKQYRPRYNSALRNDENHPYLQISYQDEYPRITVTTDNIREKDCSYIGPFYKSMMPEAAVSFANKFFGLRTCSRVFAGGESEGHPCMYLSMGTCMGPCMGNVDKELYRERLEEAVDFLTSDNRSSVRDRLQTGMEQAAAELQFETAVRFRNLLQEFETVDRSLDFRSRDSEENADLFAIASEGETAVILLYLLRNRRLSGRDLFYISCTDQKASNSRILEDFLYRFYDRSPYIPQRLILTSRISNIRKLEAFLSERKGQIVRCSTPRTGENGRFVQLTRENAEELLKRKHCVGN